jgi:NTP pyrophosphatase (non-canonical NTP hydrolase)
MIAALETRMHMADVRYGAFASTHEALGVAMEEFQELCDAVRDNDMAAVQAECLDLAAVLLRLHDQLDGNGALLQRSRK